MLRGGRRVPVDVTTLVPGDLVELRLGDIVPADVRLLEVTGLACDESVLTGESMPVDKQVARTPPRTPLAELSGCALMGTVVHAGSGRGVVVATGPRTEFGKIAAGLDTHPLDTEFQIGLRKFSMLLVYVAGTLTTSIFVMNVLLHKPVVDALLFSLAIAVGITPQLLPAVVATSLAAGSRRMTRRKVLVKRLVCIEDLGNVDMLFTDKTGTLTLGRIDFARARAGRRERPGRCDAVGVAVHGERHGRGPGGRREPARPGTVALGGGRRGSVTRCRASPVWHAAVRPRAPHGLGRGPRPAGAARLVVKGEPERVLDRCLEVPPQARTALAAEFAAGNRVVAVACPSGLRRARAARRGRVGPAPVGFLVFHDPPKPDAAGSLRRLAGLGIGGQGGHRATTPSSPRRSAATWAWATAGP